MKQIFQNLRDGRNEIVEVPVPALGKQSVLVESTVSLVSAGTERMLVEFGRSSWLGKVAAQPDKVKLVLEKARADGIAATWEAVTSKLNQAIPLGYCNVGRVAARGIGAMGWAVGQRVVSNGHHADYVVVSQNLCARIPDGVSDHAATFTVLGAIGLQGVRLANPTTGEAVAVVGLGLIGLLTVQILKANGCRVLGIDLDESRLALARRFGAETVNAASSEDVLAAANIFSRGRGMDAVLIAAATESTRPVSDAARMSRKRGRIVLVGMTGLNLSRADFYEKELTFQVSCSYGPGRYDPEYEEKGHDYPIGFVRWTEQRNFEAVLDLMAAGQIDVAPLISHRFPFERAVEAYDLLTSDEPSLGILLEYGAAESAADVRTVSLGSGERAASGVRTAFLGAGNYAGRVLMPAFREAGASLSTVVSAGGVSAVHFGRKHGFESASTDSESVLADATVDVVVVATRHNAHARQVLAALRAGKHVFCEKPLCLTLDELAEIEAEMSDRSQLLMVGFNRRFSPQVMKMQSLLAGVSGPKTFVMTVNAGAIPADHWTQDPAVGGGRIVGEGCHFIDLLRHLAGAAVSSWSATGMGDAASITLEFADGSVGTVHYFANGHKGFPKERLEVFCGGRVLQLDNFRKLRGWGWRGFRSMNLWRQDKGQRACAKAFVDAVRDGSSAPIPLAEILEVSRLSIEIQDSLR